MLYEDEITPWIFIGLVGVVALYVSIMISKTIVKTSLIQIFIFFYVIPFQQKTLFFRLTFNAKSTASSYKPMLL